MGPKQISQFLRQMATALENSKNPDRDMVVFDLNQVIAALDGDDSDAFTEKVDTDVAGRGRGRGKGWQMGPEDYDSWVSEALDDPDEGPATREALQSGELRPDELASTLMRTYRIMGGLPPGFHYDQLLEAVERAINPTSIEVDST